MNDILKCSYHVSFQPKGSEMKCTELLYIIDNDGNDWYLLSCRIEGRSKIFTKDVKAKIENGFKIIKKHKGRCVQIFIVDTVKKYQEDLYLIEVHEFK